MWWRLQNGPVLASQVRPTGCGLEWSMSHVTAGRSQVLNRQVPSRGWMWRRSTALGR